MKKLILPFLLLMTSISYAQPITNSMKTTVKINPVCSIAAVGINFGAYTPGQGDRFSTGSLSVQCTKSTTIQIGINLSAVGGNNTDDKFGFYEGGAKYSRFMTNGADRLRYNLFQNADRTIIFGGSNWFVGTGNARLNVSGTGQIENITVYGALSGDQYVTPGSYSDTAIAYVSF